MSGGLDLEQRYRRVLRLLPGYYREQWEEDMVAAFLDGWVSGDPDDDEWALEFCKPTWGEAASVAAQTRGKRAQRHLSARCSPWLSPAQAQNAVEGPATDGTPGLGPHARHHYRSDTYCCCVHNDHVPDHHDA